MSDRRPMRVRAREDGYYIDVADDDTLGPLTEDELRWLCVVLIPAALPMLPVLGRADG